jgi:hypothetical protein
MRDLLRELETEKQIKEKTLVGADQKTREL